MTAQNHMRSPSASRCSSEVPQTNEFVVAALYKFAQIADPSLEQSKLFECGSRANLLGTLLVAKEGINGTVCGSTDGVQQLVSYIRQHSSFHDTVIKYSFAPQKTFYRWKVKLKKEIVTMGIPDTDPQKIVGSYVKPEDWNALITDPDVLVVDTRNDYEIAIGTFAHAVSPETKTFREFPAWGQQLASQPEHKRPKKLAMFCTGGIRCEKATSYMKSLGFDDVFHLEGGILKYLETIPQEESLWEGECFVFDQRVSVQHGLEPGSFDMCHACRMPLASEDLQLDSYQEGISCKYCINNNSTSQKERFAQRQKQVQLAQKRQEQHIGPSHTKKTP